jgi:succinate-acetate transporter protein
VQVHKQVLLHHLGQACSGLVQFGWPGRPGAGSQTRPKKLAIYLDLFGTHELYRNFIAINSKENFPKVQLNSELCFLLISCEKYRVNLHASHEPIYTSAKKIQEQVGS